MVDDEFGFFCTAGLIDGNLPQSHPDENFLQGSDERQSPSPPLVLTVVFYYAVVVQLTTQFWAKCWCSRQMSDRNLSVRIVTQHSGG